MTKCNGFFCVCLISVPLVNMLNSNINVEPQQPYHVAPIPTVYGATAMQPTLATFQQQVPPYLRLSFIVPIVIAVVIITVACVGAYVYIRVDDRKAKMKAFRSASNVYSGTLALGPGKRFQYMSAGSGPSTSFNSCNQSIVSEEGSLSFRYSDSGSDKSRPLLSRPPLPTGVLWAQQQSPIPEEDEAIVEIGSSAYETLPFQKNFHQSTPVQNFNGMNQTNGSNHSNNSGKSPSNAKSPPFPPPPPPLPSVFGINKSSPLNQNKLNGNNIFCHADVHHVQSSGASDANNSDSYDDFHFFAPAPQHVWTQFFFFFLYSVILFIHSTVIHMRFTFLNCLQITWNGISSWILAKLIFSLFSIVILTFILVNHHKF